MEKAMNSYESTSLQSQQYQEAYKLARKRVEARMGFYGNLSSYIVVNALLMGVYFFTGPLPGYYTYPWFIWVMMAWGVGLVFHFLGVFVFGSLDSPERRQKMIQEEMARMSYFPPPPPPAPRNESASSDFPKFP
jgi:2TM domain